MSYNSKYTGEQVEAILDAVANGETGGGGGGVTVETDPVFSASPAASITEEKKAEWDGKQDAIEDLNAIRAGAEKGATALQPYITGFTYLEFETAAVNKTDLPISESEAQGLIDAINGGRIILIPCYDGGYALTLATISNPEVCVTVYFNASIINAMFLLDDILQGNVLKLDSSETVVSNVHTYSASYDADAHTIPIRDSDGGVRVNILKTDDIQVGIDEIRQTIDSLGDKVGKDEVIFKDVIGELITAQTQALYGGEAVYALPDQATGDEDDVLLSRGTVKTINGQELLADENSNDITVAYPGNEATSNAMILQPNTVTVWRGTVAETIDIAFALPLQGYVSEYIARFTVAADGVQLIVPDNVVWADSVLPAMTPGKTYEISFLSTSGDNRITATFLEF